VKKNIENIYFIKKYKMETIKRIIKQVKENKNLKPYKVVRLSTGVICEHYSNGNIKVL
jgi:ClpP class serine protease